MPVLSQVEDKAGESITPAPAQTTSSKKELMTHTHTISGHTDEVTTIDAHGQTLVGVASTLAQS